MDAKIDVNDIQPLRRAQGEPYPVVVCLCGSTKFPAEFAAANKALTLDGRIVVGPGWFAHTDPDGHKPTDEQKRALDRLHARKIDLADEVYVVNPGGYIGESTAREIAYAHATGKPVKYMVYQDTEEPEAAAAHHG